MGQLDKKKKKKNRYGWIVEVQRKMWNRGAAEQVGGRAHRVWQPELKVLFALQCTAVGNLRMISSRGMG